MLNNTSLPHLVHVYYEIICMTDKLCPIQEGVNDLSWRLAEALPVPQPLPVIPN